MISPETSYESKTLISSDAQTKNHESILAEEAQYFIRRDSFMSLAEAIYMGIAECQAVRMAFCRDERRPISPEKLLCKAVLWTVWVKFAFISIDYLNLLGQNVPYGELSWADSLVSLAVSPIACVFLAFPVFFAIDSAKPSLCLLSYTNTMYVFAKSAKLYS